MSSCSLGLAEAVNVGPDDIYYLHQDAKLSIKVIVVRSLQVHSLCYLCNKVTSKLCTVFYLDLSMSALH